MPASGDTGCDYGIPLTAFLSDFSIDFSTVKRFGFAARIGVLIFGWRQSPGKLKKRKGISLPSLGNYPGETFRRE